MSFKGYDWAQLLVESLRSQYADNISSPTLRDYPRKYFTTKVISL